MAQRIQPTHPPGKHRWRWELLHHIASENNGICFLEATKLRPFDPPQVTIIGGSASSLSSMKVSPIRDAELQPTI